MDDTQIHRLMTQTGCGGTLTPAVRRFAQACATARPWQGMRSAPKDGTAILVLMDGSDIPHAARWLAADDKRGSGSEGWHLTWDGYWLHQPRYWMACPDDPDA
jgi:hypothetical protein